MYSQKVKMALLCSFSRYITESDRLIYLHHYSKFCLFLFFKFKHRSELERELEPPLFHGSSQNGRLRLHHIGCGETVSPAFQLWWAAGVETGNFCPSVQSLNDEISNLDGTRVCQKGKSLECLRHKFRDWDSWPHWVQECAQRQMTWTWTLDNNYQTDTWLVCS